MKSKFIEHHIEDNLEKVYNEATIVLDTNSLLNLYRYSSETRAKYLEILTNVENRLFLTYNICSEFYKNRYVLIANRLVFKSTIIELIEEYNGKLLNIIQNSSCGITKFNSALSILKHEDGLRNKIIDELEKSIKKLNKLLNSFEDEIDINYLQKHDPILSEVVRIFTNKVTDEISNEEREKYFKEGAERYKKQIPPGYKDNDKPEPEKYGDLIIWKELEKLSKTSTKDILFVSDDRKEDWIIDFKGKKLGPRKELIKEFYRNTGHLYYSITTKEFIKLISEKFSVKDTETLEKETEIIQDKFQEERTISSRIFEQELLKSRDFINSSLRDPLEKWKESQELLHASLRDPLESWRKSQELLSTSLRDPLEKWRESQELFHTSLRDPLEYWRKSQELLSTSLRDPLEKWRESRELLSPPKISLSEEKLIENEPIEEKNIDIKDEKEEELKPKPRSRKKK